MAIMSSTVLTIFCLGSSPSLRDYVAQGAGVTFADPRKDGPFATQPMDALFAYNQTAPEDIHWIDKARKVFVDVPKLAAQSTRGALILRAAGQTYAIPFGQGGASIIEPSKILRGWGRRIALNLLYDSNGKLISNGNALRKGRRSQLGRGLVTDVQSSQDVTLDALGFDRAQEILRSVTVAVDRERWGRYVEGTDSFRLRWDGEFSEIPELCEELDQIFQQPHYQEHFPFIDDLRKVVDAKTLKDIWLEVTTRLVSNHLEGLGLTPQHSVDLVSTDFCLFGVSDRPKRGGHQLDDFCVAGYRKILLDLGVLSGFSVDELKKHRIRATVAGKELLEEPVFRLLEGMVSVNDVLYALTDGEAYAVSSSFVDDLDKFIDTLDADAAARMKLPQFKAVPLRQTVDKDGTTKMIRDEKAFNLAASAAAGDWLFMDSNNIITVPKRTSPVELCDILTPDRGFIHSKKGTDSATLSHLLAQATTSAELLLDSHDFRKEARHKIRAAAKSSGRDASRFDATVPLTLANGSQHTIVLAVISREWGSGPLATTPVKTVLPFFSKINIRSAITRMRGRSFTVQIARVPY